jgi:hypothetical protein
MALKQLVPVTRLFSLETFSDGVMLRLGKQFAVRDI